MSDGIYRPKYRDRQGNVCWSKVWWLRSDPITKRPVSTGCRDRKAALAFRIERERTAADPNYAASQRATIGQWVREVLKVKAARKAAGTSHMYRVKLGHIVRLFGEHTPMSAITPTTVDKYVETRSVTDGAGNNTISKELTAITQLCKYAKRGGCYPGDIKALKPVDFSTGYKPRERSLGWEELFTLWVHLPPERFAMVALIVSTAGRLSEALRSRTVDYDKARGVFLVRGTKTETSAAEIPVLSVFRHLFEAHALPYLPVTWSHISSDLPRICRSLGLEPATPNDLRRTTATMLVAAGVSTDLVSKVLRHKDARMVERVYGRVSAVQVGVVIERQLAPRVFDGSATAAPNSAQKDERRERKSPGKSEGMGAALMAPSGFKILRPHGRPSSSLGGATQQETSRTSPADGVPQEPEQEGVFDVSAHEAPLLVPAVAERALDACLVVAADALAGQLRGSPPRSVVLQARSIVETDEEEQRHG